MMKALVAFVLALASAVCGAQTTDPIRIMTVWHQAAKDWAETHIGPRGMIQAIDGITQTQIDNLNIAFANTGMYTRAANYGVMVSNSARLNVGDLYSAKSALTSDKAIVAFRDFVKADVVILVTMPNTADRELNGHLLGIAGKPIRPIHGIAVLGVDAMLGQPNQDSQRTAVFTHEIGHLLGATHAAAWTIGVTPESLPTPTTVTYGCRATVMAVSATPGYDANTLQCIATHRNSFFFPTAGGGQLRVARFSSTSTVYIGVPAQPIIDGDAAHDNAHIIDSNYTLVSSFRNTKLYPLLFQ